MTVSTSNVSLLAPVLVFSVLINLNSVLALSDEMKELAAMLHKTCVEETGVNEALIDKVNSDKIFEDDEHLKCYIKCLMVQMACISDDGIIDTEATIAVLPEEVRDAAEPVINKCGTKIGANPCENAWLTHQCYAQEKPDVSSIDINVPVAVPGFVWEGLEILLTKDAFL